MSGGLRQKNDLLCRVDLGDDHASTLFFPLPLLHSIPAPLLNRHILCLTSCVNTISISPSSLTITDFEIDTTPLKTVERRKALSVHLHSPVLVGEPAQVYSTHYQVGVVH